MKKANPKAVGGFVLGAIVLAIAVVVVFGSGKLFQERTRFIAYFPGSLQGLRVGAPVEMRGIQIGTVADIGIQVNDKLDFTFPVVMEVVSGQIRGITAHMKQAVNIKDLIAEGLRAQLVAQSLVTGQQSIQLDFYPDTPVNLAESTSPYEQVPTIPSSSEQIKGSIERVVVQASELLDRVNDVLSEENRKKISDMIVKADGIVEDIRPTMEAFRHAAETADATLTDLGKDREEFAKLLEDGQQTLIAYKNLAERADGVIASNEDGIKQAIGGMVEIERRLGSLADASRAMIEENRRGVTEFSNNGLVELTNLAIDAQAAVEQFRRVMEEMERDPARFFLGRPGQIQVQ